MSLNCKKKKFIFIADMHNTLREIQKLSSSSLKKKSNPMALPTVNYQLHVLCKTTETMSQIIYYCNTL